MLYEVKRLILNEKVSENDIADSASYLLKKQFVLRSEPGDSAHFVFIDKHLRLFQDWFSFMGADLEINYDAGFIGYKPKKSLSNLKLNETAVLIVLRLIYHNQKLAGASELNYVTVSGQLLIDEYRRLTGRDDLSQKGSFKMILRPLKQKSVIKFGEEDFETGVKDVVILPTIEMAIDKSYADNLMDAIINAEQLHEKGEEDSHEAD